MLTKNGSAQAMDALPEGSRHREGSRRRPGDSRLARYVDRVVRTPRSRPWLVLGVALALESACLVALGAVNQTRQVLGLPGSLMALVAIVAGALGGPLVGLAAALGGGAVYYATIASLGARGSWLATLVSIAIWCTAGLVSAAAADALRRQTARLRQVSLYSRSLLEAALDPLVTIGRDGKITDVNAATEKATGVVRAELIGTDFSDYFTDPEQARAGYRHAFDQGSVLDYSLAIRHTSGRIMEVLYNGTLYRDADGEVAGVFAAARDVTERKKAEEQLRAASVYSRSLLEASLDPLVTISSEGKITDVNIAAERATGVARAELIDTDFSDYFTEPERARVGYQKVFNEGFVRDYPLAIRHVSGQYTDVLYNASVYRDEAGRPVGVFAAARDITERKRAERALLRVEMALRAEKEELARSNADLEQFAYVASHDLQEPLRMVASYTQLLARRYRGKLDDEADEFIEFAVDGANRMQDLIRDLLAFSRVGTQGKPLVDTDCDAVAQRALTNLKVAIEESGAHVMVDRLPTVSADADQLVQVLQNLIANAIKFHGEEPPQVQVSASRGDGEWVFAVRDNGIGLDAQYADRIFIIFQRLHGRGEFAGTGIGLALCKKIVSRHGGRIWVESEPGKGSTFSFTLPIKGDGS